MHAKLLEIIQSDAPDVAAVNAILAENPSEENLSWECSTLLRDACDEYQMDMRNAARKDIIFALLDYLKKSEYPRYAIDVLLCYERFRDLSYHYSIPAYGRAAGLFKDRLYTDRLSVSHSKKIGVHASFSHTLYVFSKLGGALGEFSASTPGKDLQPIDAFKLSENGESSIIGFVARHYYFIEKQQGNLKKLFHHDVTTWPDFIRVLSALGLDTRSEFILYNQGEQPMGIARFLFEKLNQPEVFLAVMASPEVDLILSKENRQTRLSWLFNVDQFMGRVETLLQASTWELASSSDAIKMEAALNQEKKLVQACITSGVIAASQLTLAFLAVATQVMRAEVVEWKVEDGRYRAMPYMPYHCKKALTFKDNEVLAEVGEGLLAKLGEDEKSWVVFPKSKLESPMLAFARYLTPEQAERLVNEFASGRRESRLGYAMGKMFEEVNSYYFPGKYKQQAYAFFIYLLAKCGQIPSGFIERLPMMIKSQFSLNDYRALLMKAGITDLALANELRLVFNERGRSLDEVKMYLRLLFLSQLPLAELVQVIEVWIINKQRHGIDDVCSASAIEQLLDMLAKNFNLTIYEVCRALPDAAKEGMTIHAFLGILRRPNALTPLSDIAPLLTQKQRDELKNILVAGLREVGDTTAFIENKGLFLSKISSIRLLNRYPYSDRFRKWIDLENMLQLLPNFRDWQALSADLGWSHEGKTVLDRGGDDVYGHPYNTFKFYFMNASLQAHYHSLPLSLFAEWSVIMVALTGLSQHVFNTPADEGLGLNSFEQSLIFWMTQKKGCTGVPVVNQSSASSLLDQSRCYQIKDLWEKQAYVSEGIKSVAKKEKIQDEGALNQKILEASQYDQDGEPLYFIFEEVIRLASFWMFETKAVSKENQGLIGPIQAAFLILLKRHASLRAALREQMVLGGDCLLSSLLKKMAENKAYVEARALLRDAPLSDDCINELARRIDANECTVRDVVLYLGLKPSLTDEQLIGIANKFLDKSVDGSDNAAHAQIQDALLTLSEKAAEYLKARLSVCMVKSGAGRQRMQALFARPEEEANNHLIWHIIHAGKRTATIKSTQNAKQVKACLAHPEYSLYKIYGLFKLPPPEDAILDPARAQEGKGSLLGGVVDRLGVINSAHRRHEEVDKRFEL
jgi:hypothetical protein